jgi:hypothetical protein
MYVLSAHGFGVGLASRDGLMILPSIGILYKVTLSLSRK